MITSNYTINFSNQTVATVIPVVQGDTGRVIELVPVDFTIPADATATFYIKKPSGSVVNGAASISGGSVVVTLTAQTLAEAGECKLQVRLEKSGECLTSFEVVLLVQPFHGVNL